MSSHRSQSQASLPSLPGANDITRVGLSNGCVVLSRPNFNSPSIVVSGYLTAGSLLESDEKLGLANFTALALMRGTAQHNFQQIFDALESVGASLSFSGGTHTTGFGGKSLVEDLDMLLDLLAETLRTPTFPDEQVERLRSQLLTSLAIRAQDTSQMASLTFDQLIYPNHPYCRPGDGYPETIQAILNEDLVKFHKQNYGPQGMVIAVVGAIDPQLAVEKVRQVLGDWENPAQPEPVEVPPVSMPEKMATGAVEIANKFQCDVILGVAGPPRRSPDFLACALGNSVLGQFGLMGRIGEAVREKAGLAYYAYSSLNGGSGPGPWDISAGVNPANVNQVIDLIRDEIRRFVSEPVTSEELEDSQTNFIGRLPLTLETNGGVAAAILNLERFELGLDYYRQYAELVKAVTRDDVLEAAQRYLHPDRLGIAIAGPPGTSKIV